MAKTRRSTKIAAADKDVTQSATIRRRKYRRDFLASVIARIDFAAPLPLAKKGPPAAVVAALKKEFPIAELQVKQIKEVFIPADSSTRETTREVREWNYHSKNREKKVVVTADCMFLESKKYQGFKVLRTDFLNTTNALFDAFKDLEVKRLGLRYINKIVLKEPKPTVWERYLNENLLSSFKLVTARQTLVRVFHVLEQKFDDESRIRFQYGMTNPDYPAVIHRKHFVLDSDAYCELIIGRDEVERFLDIFHDRCKERFEQLITDPLRRQMTR
jgi:uncharacterized protein (TIGR04255 family)